jgi:predicted GTPase
MISRRSIVLGLLFVVPIVIYVGAGGYALVTTGLWQRLWWLLPLCWLITWGLSKFWKAKPAAARVEKHSIPIPAHWTTRDEEAAKIIREFQDRTETYTPEQLIDPAFYQTQGQALAVALARHYHPSASDPYSSLTVPEVLAAVRLVVDDMEQWLLTSVPGSRLLTIKHWRMLGSAPHWYRRIQDTAWVASILINPLNIARYFSSKLTVDPVTAELQNEVLAAIYLRFIRQLGFYFIEMNSGRLRGGADVYRQTFQLNAAGVASRVSEGNALKDVAAQPVAIALVGQVSSGKSSLVNALTGSNQAHVDILPATRNVNRYQVALGEPAVTVTLLDTPGYGEAGASAEQLKQIQSALRESNCALLVMDTHSPARDADVTTLRELETWYSGQRHLKAPPVIGVLTHIDLLKPSLEWTPPYDWRNPSSPKEHSIHDAQQYVQGLFGKSLAAIVPVCSASRMDRSWGILEELVPAMTARLSDAHSVALLRAFEKQLDRDRLKTLLSQIGRSGGELFRWWVEERLMPPK